MSLCKNRDRYEKSVSKISFSAFNYIYFSGQIERESLKIFFLTYPITLFIPTDTVSRIGQPICHIVSLCKNRDRYEKSVFEFPISAFNYIYFSGQIERESLKIFFLAYPITLFIPTDTVSRIGQPICHIVSLCKNRDRYEKSVFEFQISACNYIYFSGQIERESLKIFFLAYPITIFIPSHTVSRIGQPICHIVSLCKNRDRYEKSVFEF